MGEVVAAADEAGGGGAGVVRGEGGVDVSGAFGSLFVCGRVRESLVWEGEFGIGIAGERARLEGRAAKRKGGKGRARGGEGRREGGWTLFTLMMTKRAPLL